MVEFRLTMKVRKKALVFSGDSLKYSEKKKLSCKQVLLKRISNQEMFSRKGVLKIQTNHNRLYKT